MVSGKARIAIAASVSAGMLVAAPIFYSLYAVATAETPAHAQHLKPAGGAVWKGMNKDGDTVYLRFNRFGMASYTCPECTHKGPVTFAEGSLTLEPIPLPLLSALGSARTLQVGAWPTDKAPDTAQIEGVQMYRME